MPTSAMQRSTVSFAASTLTPSAPRTSAEPERDETARLPCFATVTPAPATTNAAVVEMLKVFRPSPPVPQVSTNTAFSTWTRSTRARITSAAPVISSTVSPFSRSAARNAPTCAGVASPSAISVITAAISARVRSWDEMSFCSACWITGHLPPRRARPSCRGAASPPR